MLSDSLVPDQDLQSGSKLVTWYDVCCNIRGDYVLVVKFSGGDYVLVVKFSGGDYVLVVKFMGGILSTYTKMSRGGFVWGGLCPYQALEKSRMIISVCLPLSVASASSWTRVTNLVSRLRHAQKPCWHSVSLSGSSKCLMLLVMMCSWTCQ